MSGVQATGVEWIYQGLDDNTFNVGIENELHITVTVHFTDTSADAMGCNLWRIGLFGSKNYDGSGEKLNYNSQILNDAEASKSLLDAAVPLQFRDARAMFDILALGCGQFTYDCMEFTKNEAANPDFSFSVLPLGDTITSCRHNFCRRGKPNRGY